MAFFSKEYPKYSPDNKKWKNGLFSAAVILLIFLLFQPFGFRDKEMQLKLVLFPGYALFAYLYSHFNFLIIRHILIKKKIWTYFDELINVLIWMIVLTVAIHLFSYWITGDLPLTFQWYFRLLYHVTSLFLVIGIIEFFYYNNKAANVEKKTLSSQYENARQKLDSVKKQNKDIISVSLEKEKIEINRNKIIYIESVGNYLEFCLREANGEINKIIKRGRLHKIENDLAPFSEFFRCQRAFIINLKQTDHLKGNTKNARVIIAGKPQGIPVSRSQYTGLKEQLEKITLS